MLKEMSRGILLVMLLVIVLVQHGNAEKLGNKFSSEYKLKGDFAIVTGNITTPVADSEVINASVLINYPTGFNKNNCVIVSLMSKNNTISTEDKRQWSTIALSSSTSALWANTGLTAALRENDICVQVWKVHTTEGSKNVGIKLILMKI